MSFNTATYNASSVAYNTEYPTYIDGTTPTIPINGTNYYNNYFGNVMCAFAVDGGDSVLGGNVIVTGALNVGGNIVANAGSNAAGLKFTLYSGYNNDVPTYSVTATKFTGAAGASVGYSSDLSNMTTATLNNVTTGLGAFSIEWTGYFYTGTGATGTWTFSTNSDDNSFIWLGPTATTGYTVANAVVNNGGLHGMKVQTGSVVLTTNTFYPIRILFGNYTGGYDIITTFTPPGGVATTNGTGYYFSTNNTTTSVSAANLSYLSGATSNLQTQINNIPAAILPLANTWTGTNAYNTSLPTSTITPTSATQLTTKTYVDTTFQSYPTTSSVTSAISSATSDMDTITKRNQAIANTLSATNAWTGSNAYNTSLPTSTLTPTTSSQLTTKSYVDSLNPIGLANTWTGASNTFTRLKSTGNVFLNTGVGTFIVNPTLYDYNTWYANANYSNAGLQVGWNAQTGYGRTDFLCNAQGGLGGFDFWTMNATNQTPSKIATITSSGCQATAFLEPTSGMHMNHWSLVLPGASYRYVLPSAGLYLASASLGNEVYSAYASLTSANNMNWSRIMFSSVVQLTFDPASSSLFTVHANGTTGIKFSVHRLFTY